MADLDARVAAVVATAAERVPAFAARLADAGLTPQRIRGARDLDALPVLTKDDLLELQRQDPPFGGMLAWETEVRRVFQSPGPIYEPQLAGADPWRWQEALRSLGLTASDVLINCFSYHLSPAGAMFDEAARVIGCSVLPGGIGNLDLQAQAVGDLGVTAYIGLPSYLNTLIECYEASGLDPARWRLQRALVTAEPLLPELRALLSDRVPTVRMAYGTAETGLLGYEIEPGAGLVVPDGVLVQICDLDSGAAIESGEGQIVITLLRPDYPLVRFGTGDVSAWVDGPDGSRRLAGVLGRVGAAVKVRGMFLHPRQVEHAMRDMPGVASYRFIVDRIAHRDELRCQVVPEPGALPDQVAIAVQDRVRSALRFRTEVAIVDTLEKPATLVDARKWDDLDPV